MRAERPSSVLQSTEEHDEKAISRGFFYKV